MHFKVVSYDARAMTRRLHIYKCIYRYSYIYVSRYLCTYCTYIYVLGLQCANGDQAVIGRGRVRGGWRPKGALILWRYERKILYISRSQRDWNIIRTMHKYTSTSHAFNKRPPLEIIKTHSLYYYYIYLYNTYDDDPFSYCYYKI